MLAPPSDAPPGTTAPADADRRFRPAVFRRLAHLRLGLLGQVLTFAAMVIPIVLREGEQVYVLVFTSAVAIALVAPGLLGYQFVYPVVRGTAMARVATGVAVTSLSAVSLLVLPGTLVEQSLDLPAGTFAVAALLLFSQGLYNIVITQLVRHGDIDGIGLARLVYGGVLLVLTVVASVWRLTPLGLSLAVALAYLVTVVQLRVRRGSAGSRDVRPPSRHRLRLARAYVRRSVHPTLSSLANGWVFFLPGIALPGLGVATEPWAIVTRICGGFATLLQTILGPPQEARMARAVRERDPIGFERSRRSALLVGAAVSVFAMLAGLGLALYEDWGSVEEWWLPTSVATVLFWGVLLAGTPINRVPNFVGRDAVRLLWDGARAVLVTIVFVVTDGVARLVVTGAVLTLFGLVLIPMSRYRSVSDA